MFSSGTFKDVSRSVPM